MKPSTQISFPDIDLRGRTAIVTGSTRGVGRQIALDLADHGCNVVIAAKSTEENPNLPGTIYSVAREVESRGVRALPVKLDVRSDTDIENMVENTMKSFGRIDILVCNSGALWWKDVIDTPMSKYDLVHSVNSRGAFACTRACLPHMLKSGFGHVIVMSPPIDMALVPGKVAYCISKFGMTMLALGLSKELQDTGIAINAIWPMTLIESYATINFNLSDPSQWRKASILSDCILNIVSEDPRKFSGNMLLDEPYLKSKGVKDFAKYRVVPDVEPEKVTEFPKQKSKL
eukprot:CAMPEP_0184692442 /NCGR_PEP_ID=MMETSP0313-20130426/923_1 /TAXON_ID=2792 /ORGANISM="Porphyridium aerugineum, Strain SAG 1380-2" /LENGTH=286 /DNA_ID=CAMNT_0027150275 /DNA_START=48 /DNA_END=908 /DNA_ORIENTATION=+